MRFWGKCIAKYDHIILHCRYPSHTVQVLSRSIVSRSALYLSRLFVARFFWKAIFDPAKVWTTSSTCREWSPLENFRRALCRRGGRPGGLVRGIQRRHSARRSRFDEHVLSMIMMARCARRWNGFIKSVLHTVTCYYFGVHAESARAKSDEKSASCGLVEPNVR